MIGLLFPYAYGCLVTLTSGSTDTNAPKTGSRYLALRNTTVACRRAKPVVVELVAEQAKVEQHRGDHDSKAKR